MKKRPLFLIVVLVIVAMVLPSCAAKSTPTSEVVSPATEEVPSEVPQTTTENPTEASFDWQKYAGESIVVLNAEQPVTVLLQQYLPEFEELTGIDVDYQVLTEDQMREKQLIALQAGSDEFDVYQTLPSREGKMFAEGGYMEPLDSYIAEKLPPDYDFEGIGEGALGGMKFDDVTYALPVNIEGPVLYYRTDLFETYDIPVPTTLAEIKDAAAALAEVLPEGIYPITLRGKPQAIFYDFSPFIHNYAGGYVVDGEPTLSTEAGLEAVRLYTTLAATYGPPGVVNNGFSQSVSLFMSGNAAMLIEASDQTMNVNDETQSSVVGNVAMMAVPPGPYGDHPALISWGLALNPNSGKKDAGWYFIAWATGKAMQDKMQIDGLPSPRPSSWEQQEWLDQLSSPILEQYTNAMNHMLVVGQGNIGPAEAADQPGIRQAMGEAFNKIMLGEATLEEGAAEADEVIREYIK